MKYSRMASGKYSAMSQLIAHEKRENKDGEMGNTSKKKSKILGRRNRSSADHFNFSWNFSVNTVSRRGGRPQRPLHHRLHHRHTPRSHRRVGSHPHCLPSHSRPEDACFRRHLRPPNPSPKFASSSLRRCSFSCAAAPPLQSRRHRRRRRFQLLLLLRVVLLLHHRQLPVLLLPQECSGATVLASEFELIQRQGELTRKKHRPCFRHLLLLPLQGTTR